MTLRAGRDSVGHLSNWSRTGMPWNGGTDSLGGSPGGEKMELMLNLAACGIISCDIQRGEQIRLCCRQNVAFGYCCHTIVLFTHITFEYHYPLSKRPSVEYILDSDDTFHFNSHPPNLRRS